jgi:anti-anti-sigma regulatory factor
MSVIRLVFDCSGLTSPTVSIVGELARLQRRAQRAGCRLEFDAARPSLVELLDLCGLVRVLRVEMKRQAEERKDPRGVEEEGELPDPAA